MVKTEIGTRYLREIKDVELFKEQALSEQESITKRRAALWALGHVGSTAEGLKLIKEQKIMKTIVKMAESSEHLSLRGYGFS